MTTTVLRRGLLLATLSASLWGCVGRALDSTSQEGNGDDDLRPAQLSGAIWTTDESGQRVNQNLYEMPCDVYLNGGPQKVGAAGLPEGDYYFQVTEPSGSDNSDGGPSRLLTTDEIRFRQFHVGASGEIDGVSGDGDRKVAGGGDADARIQLCPFLQSSNNGCVHKVWITRVEDYVAAEAGEDAPANSTFGFRHNRSKTDVFKVCAPEGGEGGGGGGGEEEGGDETSDQLLATTTFEFKGGLAGSVDSLTPRVWVHPDRFLFDSLNVTAADAGVTFFANAENDADFLSVAGALSDGLEEQLAVELLLGTGSLGQSRLESLIYPEGDPDFAAFTITRLGLRFDALSLTSSATFTNIAATVVVEIYGVPGEKPLLRAAELRDFAADLDVSLWTAPEHRADFDTLMADLIQTIQEGRNADAETMIRDVLMPKLDDAEVGEEDWLRASDEKIHMMDELTILLATL